MKKKGWGFDRKDLDKKVRPQDDFFHYAGGGWMKRNSIPKHESRWGSFMILRHTVDTQLHSLVTEIEKKRSVKKGSTEQMLRDFLRSGMNTGKRKELGLIPLKKHFALIEAMKSSKDFVPTVAKLEKLGMNSLWGVFVDQDMKNSERYMLHFVQGGLGMPDRDYYLKNTEDSKRVHRAYKTHLEKIITFGKFSKDVKKDVAIVDAIEKALAKASMTKEDRRDADKTYFKYTLRKLKRHVPQINWDLYFHILNIKVPEVIVMQPLFFKAVGKMIEQVSIEHWKTYLKTHLINDFASFLTPELEKEAFAFYGTVLTGTTHMKPLWRRVLGVVNSGMGELLGKLYVERHFPPEAKKQMLEMVNDLMTAYEARIKNLDWMSPVTKKKALKKLSQITPKIGYPDVWKEYKGVAIDAEDYVGNILRIGKWNDKRELGKLRKKKVDRKEWFMYPQTVNAYYSAGMNDIAFPAGILQPPFFDPNADDAINYGSIGAVIGHEITHGFDDQGSKFDGFGNRKTWWTKKDKNQFTKKAQVLVKEFDSYTVAGGLKVNGTLTLGENIADLGGMSIAYDAYLLKLARTKRENIAGFSPEQRFFLGASLFERELTRPEFTKMQVTTDPHSPALFRVNGPVSNLPEFYQAYKVRKGDKLYREPKKRAKIW